MAHVDLEWSHDMVYDDTRHIDVAKREVPDLGRDENKREVAVNHSAIFITILGICPCVATGDTCTWICHYLVMLSRINSTIIISELI